MYDRPALIPVCVHAVTFDQSSSILLTQNGPKSNVSPRKVTLCVRSLLLRLGVKYDSAYEDLDLDSQPPTLRGKVKEYFEVEHFVRLKISRIFDDGGSTAFVYKCLFTN